MMKRIFFIIYSLLLSAAALAQPKIKVEHESQKLGDLAYQLPKTVTYTLHNAGKSPLIINEVHPSCGCVSVTFPHQPIPAGKDATITAVYDAMMLGTFHRELAVYTNASEQPLYLTFSGRVVDMPSMESYEEEYPIDLDNVRLNTNAIEFDDVNKGDQPVAEIKVLNVSDHDFAPQLMHLPDYLKAEYFPATIRKGRVGKVRITLISDKLMMDGLNQTSVYMARYMGDRVGEKNEIVVSAVRLPSFQGLTASQLEKAPVMVFMDGEQMLYNGKSEDANNDATTIVIPSAGRKKKLSKTLDLTNVGESDLMVQTVQVFNSAIGVRLSHRVIPAHGTAKLKITVDTRLLARAKAQPRILIISNDPRNAKVLLNVKIQ